MPALELDVLDLRIAAVLQADSSISNLDLAQRVHASAPTCLRRVRKLKEAGLIEREFAVLDLSKLASMVTAVIEVSLDRQAAEDYDDFERYVCTEPAVTQCYRVSPGPDFIVIAELPDMRSYDEFARRLFTQASNVRNVRTFFSMRRAKFESGPPIGTIVRPG
ncbi:Lrp/AsnC family transcriptional regulator [Trinickia soli]|uniref:Lrp/AsnC family transcriptional regulator n=1 Tax=Trinickia soli TaxID=380675 RepID=UPI003FA3D5F7